jgi:hypothetical protein
MSKLFQIEESDLGELEKLLPEICQSVMATLDNRLRMKFRKCQAIVSNVRWGYGPPTDVEIIPAGDQP